MTDSTGESGFLPTVTFASSDATFTSAERIAQLSSIGITGFYEADFADNITTIDVSAFAFDTKVVVATINGVTSIRSDAFYGCTAMRSITLDTSVNPTTKKYLLTDISSGAFQGCTSLRNLHIPDTVKIIPDNMCNGCTSLDVAVMGYGWDRINDGTTNAYITNGRIGMSAFANCSKLPYFIVPETVGGISDSAFANDVSLALVYILGRPDVSANAFTSARGSGATYYFDNSASYTTLTAVTSGTLFPTGSTQRRYREFTITAAGQLTAAVVRSTILENTYWKGKILNAVTSLADYCFKGQSVALGGINTIYPYMIGLSFPPTLLTIGQGAFSNNDGTSGYTSIIGAFYIPNTVTTFVLNATYPTVSNTFNYLNTGLRDPSTTRQIVFQSGTNTYPLSAQMFYYTSARAIIAPTATTVWLNCFTGAQYIQLFSFFQKNAYTSLTKLDYYLSDDSGADSFGSCFNTGSRQYIYIPKQITRIGLSAFLSITDKLLVTVYSSTTDGASASGLSNFLTSARFTGTAPTFHLINNYYDANGVTLATGKPDTSTYHVLFHPSVKTITNRFASNAFLKTVTIPDTVTDICANAFISCTGLANVYISPTSNLTIINESAINNCTSLTSFFIPNSLKRIDTYGLFACGSLATVTYGDNPGLKSIGNSAFGGTTKTLTNIFIPSSVVSIGNSAFIVGEPIVAAGNVNILNTVTFGAGSRLKSIDYWCFGYNSTGITRAAQYLHDIVLPSSLRYMGPITNNVNSPFQNTHMFVHSANFVVPSSVQVIPWGFLFCDNAGTVDISNVYFPRSITNVAGPRVHNGYSANGFAGSEFTTSKTGSLLYLPSELSSYAGALPGTNRTRSYYRTVSYTTNPLTSLALSSTNPITNAAGAAVTNAATTTQIHADIKEGVIVIGDGTTSIASANSGNALNLISVNIPSTVTNISANAFNGCSAMAYVTFSENSRLTTIGNSAFMGCNTIHDIQLPDTLTTIGTNAFSGCYNLASISIPYNVTSIGAGAFNININTPTTYIARPQACLAYQLGGDIYGEAADDFSGYFVSISQDGKILAIGAHQNDASGGNTGHVRVYKYQTIPVENTTWANYTVGSFSNTGTSPYNKPIVVNGGDALPVSGKSYWVQLGSDINGEAAGDKSGLSVSLSSDGTTVAIGSTINTGGGTAAGQTRVYKYQPVTDASWNSYTINSFLQTGTAPNNKPILVNGGDASSVSGKSYWAQLGSDINGEIANSSSGYSVSLSSNGTIVAIGAPLDDPGDTGCVRVYQYNSGTGAWSKLGSTITAGSAADEFGFFVSLNDAGTVLAIGAMRTDIPGTDAGAVRVYAYSGSAWTQRGSNINGDATYDYSGVSVSLNSDGNILAIGAIGNDGTTGLNADNRGQARVYNWNGSSWVKLGQNINGLASGDELGVSVSLNTDGTILAVGSRLSDTGLVSNTGLVRIYKYIGGTWQQLGQDIKADFANDQAAWSVSISKDGTTVAFGAHLNDGNGVDSGMVRVYQINQLNVPIRLHQKLYNDISGSLSTYFPGINTSALQVIPALTLTNTLNPSKLTISQINNMYIRYRQSQLGGCTRVTVSASSGSTLQASDVTNALLSSTGLVHLDIGSNVTSIATSACQNNLRIYSVAISKTVVTFGTSVFNGCTNLSYLSFHPDSVCTTIGNSAFLGTSIIDLALPDSLTTIGTSAFQNSPNLTSVCIPKNVTSLGTSAFLTCSKLTFVALPASLTALATGSYFSRSGSVTTGITFTYYSAASAIAHFKLSDYSMPNGIVQNVIDSAVKYIDHRAYAYYPDITLYAVTTTKNQTQTPGQYSYTANNIQMSIMPAAFWVNGSFSGASTTNSMFPIYRSAPDLNVFSLSTTANDWLDDKDDFYILMPGYSICIYNNLYDEENLFTESPLYRYYDNEFGTVPLNITLTSDAILNKTSSILIMFNGRILSKYFAT